jgi:ABC-type multidrug transport system fused ATPase/permease subunit
VATWRERIRHLPAFLILVWRCAPWNLMGVLVVRIGTGLVPLLNLFITRDVVNVASVSLQAHHLYGSAVEQVFELFAGVKLASLVLSALDTQWSSMLGQKVGNYVTEAVMSRAAGLPYETLAQGETQDLLYFLRQETASRPISIIQALLSGVGAAVTWISVIIYVFSWNWLLALLIVFAVVPMSVVQIAFGRRSYRLAQEVAPISRQNYYLTLLLTTGEYLREILSYGASRLLIRRHNGVFRRVYGMRVALLTRRTLWTAIASFIANACVLFVQYEIVVTAVVLRLTIGDVTALFQAVGTLWTSTQSVVAQASSIYTDLLFANRLSRFLELDRESDSQPQAKGWTGPSEIAVGAVSPGSAVDRFSDNALELRHVSYAYDGHKVLRDVNLRVPFGRPVGLTGANGSGKTTLCALIQGLREEQSGEVLVRGRLCAARERLKLCSTLYQDFTRYELTYRENISISNPDRMGADEVADFIVDLDAHSLLAADRAILERRLGTWFPDSLQLSGGQWQRVALYRALYRQAAIYLLDEPTASLDPAAVDDVVEMLRRASDGAAMLIVSHDRTFLEKVCDQIYVLNAGQLLPAAAGLTP